MKFVIEFRSGTYLVSLDADRGGTLQQAMQFDSSHEAEAFADAHDWIWFNDGGPDLGRTAVLSDARRQAHLPSGGAADLS